MKKHIIISNWKSYITSLSQAKKLIEIIYPEHIISVICPPTPFLAECEYFLEEKRISLLGAQEIGTSPDQGGSPTGTTTPKMLKALKVKYCIIGHAEQRMAGEKDEHIAEKIKMVHKENITPILCVGSDKKNTQQKVITEQLRLVQDMKKKIIVAYEPVYAIGAKKPASKKDINSIVSHIRTLVPKNTAVLYGGSVQGHHAGDLLEHCDINGFLIGRASTSVSTVKEILKYV